MHAIIIPVVLLLGIPTILLLCTSFGRLVTRLSGTAGLSVLVMVPFGLVIGTALGFACSLLLTTPLRRAVRREMNVLGLPICTGCGYNLAGLACDPSTCADVRVCPECGADLPAARLTTSTIRARHLHWEGACASSSSTGRPSGRALPTAAA